MPRCWAHAAPLNSGTASALGHLAQGSSPQQGWQQVLPHLLTGAQQLTLKLNEMLTEWHKPKMTHWAVKLRWKLLMSLMWQLADRLMVKVKLQKLSKSLQLALKLMVGLYAVPLQMAVSVMVFV